MIDTFRCTLLILATSLILPSTLAQFGFGGPKGPEPKAVRSDIPFIRCEVCEHLAKQAYRQVGAFKKEAADKKMKHERKVYPVSSRPKLVQRSLRLQMMASLSYQGKIILEELRVMDVAAICTWLLEDSLTRQWQNAKPRRQILVHWTDEVKVGFVRVASWNPAGQRAGSTGKDREDSKSSQAWRRMDQLPGHCRIWRQACLERDEGGGKVWRRVQDHPESSREHTGICRYRHCRKALAGNAT